MAKSECILQLNGMSYDNIQAKILDLNKNIKSLKKEIDINIILNKHAAILEEIELIRTYTKDKSFEFLNQPLENLKNDFKELYIYLNKAINKNYYDTLQAASELKTEKGNKID